MSRVCQFGLVLGAMLAVCLAAACGSATPDSTGESQDQTPASTVDSSPAAEHVFRGRVEEVDPSAGTLRVFNENVEGWMGPMSMIYSADDEAVYSRVKPGDQITATVRDGDFKMLYGVQVVETAEGVPSDAGRVDAP